MSTILLSGASGLVGSAIAAALRAKGDTVVPLSRRPGPDGLRFALKDEQAPKLPRADALIHCAHDFRPRTAAENERVNVEGSRRLLRAARDAGVPRLLFVSSVAAFEGTEQHYGAGKLAVEREVAEMEGISLRPGLVWGGPPAGIFGMLVKAARLPIAPVFDRGTQPLQLAHVDDVGAAIAAAVGLAKIPPKPIVLAHPRPWPFRELLRALASARHHRIAFVPIPGRATLGTLQFLERRGVKLPMRADSLLGLLHRAPSFDFGPIAEYGWNFRDFDPARPLAGA